MLFQTCIGFFLLLNTKEDILNNVGKQRVIFFFPTMEVNGYRLLSGYQYILL